MKLRDLCGKHTFSGCELTREPAPDYCYEDYARVCIFTLDGVHYKIVEDPDDGYRSYCRELEVSDTKPKYSFPSISVECSMKPDGDLYKHDVLIIKDAITNKPILKVGTEYVDDYYPCCIFEYHPENMCVNQPEKEEEKKPDLVEVIRCENCKFYDTAEYDQGTKCVCRLYNRQMYNDDFCSYAIRRNK